MIGAARKLAILAAVAAGAPASADVVLLRGGGLVEGKVQRADDAITVEQSHGSLRLRPDSVVTIAASPLAAYDWLRGQELANDPTAGAHLRIADWAMSQSLWPQAARELLDAKLLEPTHPRLALLQRRLAELSQPAAPRPARSASSVGADPTRRQGTLVSGGLDTDSPLPRLPHDGLPYFTRRVQPLLLNGCAIAGCHRGEDGDRFPLDVTALHTNGDVRTTDHNLRVALAALDLQKPIDSPLLVAAHGPHAGVSPLAGRHREELIDRLERWAESVALANGVEVGMPEQAPVAVAETSRPEPAATPLASNKTSEDSQVYEPYQPKPPAPPQRGVVLERVELRDEFDPEIFNQRFGGSETE